MARLVVALVFLGIYFVIWLVKKAGPDNRPGSNLPSSQELDRLMAASKAAGGYKPPLQLPAGNRLLLSAETNYRGLDETMIIVGFMRTHGPHEGEPDAATFRRGPVEIKYAYDAATNRRELSFEGEGWEKAREQVAGKVTWLRG